MPSDSPRRYIIYPATAPAISVPQKNALFIVTPSVRLGFRTNVLACIGCKSLDRAWNGRHKFHRPHERLSRREDRYAGAIAFRLAPGTRKASPVVEGPIAQLVRAADS